MKKILLILCLISTASFADNYAIVDHGTVTNVIDYDGKSPYTPPTGDTLVKDTNNPPQVAMGWTYDGEDFSPPAQPVQPTPPSPPAE